MFGAPGQRSVLRSHSAFCRHQSAKVNVVRVNRFKLKLCAESCYQLLILKERVSVRWFEMEPGLHEGIPGLHPTGECLYGLSFLFFEGVLARFGVELHGQLIAFLFPRLLIYTHRA